MLRYTGVHYGWCTMEGQAQKERGCGQTCEKYTNWIWAHLPNMKGKARPPRKPFGNTPMLLEKHVFMGFLPWVHPRFLPHILRILLCNSYPRVPLQFAICIIMSTCFGAVVSPCDRPRTYPVQYGRNLLHAFENHIGSCPARRDLRFKPQYNKWMSEREQFELLPLGDCWEEANLLPVVTYLMTSSKCRRGLLFIEANNYNI